MRISDRFILKPDFHNLGELGLDYKDLLTYITIRSFYNPDSKYCYPGYRAISKLSGLSTHFIAKSIKRLNEAGILKVLPVIGRRRKAYWYVFGNISGLSRVPLELLVDKDLTTNEKSILVLLFEYCKHGFCSESLAEITDRSGVSYRVLKSHYQSLILKGFIVESMYEDPLSNTLTRHFAFTNKLPWSLTSYNFASESSADLSIDDMFKIYHNHRKAVTSATR